jgi:hypothetical protein
LQRYLDKAWDIFFAPARYGIQQSPILETAYRYDDLVSEGDRPALADRLATIRGNVARKLSRIVAAQTADGGAPPTTYIDARGATITNLQTGDGPVEDKSVHIGNVGGSITGAVGADISIQDSFKTINDSGAGEELKTKLTDLTNAVAELCKALPAEQAETTARDLKTFNEEATAKAPRKSILEAIGGALSKTAEAVATVGPPVVALVKAILLIV